MVEPPPVAEPIRFEEVQPQPVVITGIEIPAADLAWFAVKVLICVSCFAAGASVVACVLLAIYAAIVG